MLQQQHDDEEVLQAQAAVDAANMSEEDDQLQQQMQSSQFRQEMAEMDLNVYEDDDDETLHRKLIAAKIARKRAEEDHKLLSNRIALLK